MSISSIKDMNLSGQRVLIREDFNAPISSGVIIDDTRLRAALPTIQYALSRKAAVIVMSHLGQPQAGKVEPIYSLQPIAKRLSELLNQPITFVPEWISGVDIQPGHIICGENVRFLKGETEDDPELAKKMANLCDIFVMDAFASAHRAHASTHGVAKFASKACAGLLLTAEIEALNKAWNHPKHPVLAIVGGAKVSTKLKLLRNLLTKTDYLIVGGAIANTFLVALGFDVGTSLHEAALVPEAKALLKDFGKKIILPKDVGVTATIDEKASIMIKDISKVSQKDRIVDVGPQTSAYYQKFIQNAATIIWNGPVGIFEYANFSQGTKHLCEAIANSDAYTLAGGGDTISAIEKFKIHQKISYISTGGGAFLAYLEGDSLPGIKVLEKN